MMYYNKSDAQVLSQIEQSLSPYFKMVWDDIANAPETTASGYNPYFGTDDITNGVGFPFFVLNTNVNTQTLYGGVGLQFGGIFSSNTNLISVESNILGLSAPISNTFLNAVNITTFNLPTLIYIGNAGFQGCIRVRLFDLSSLQGLGTDVFAGITNKTFIIKVPLSLSTDVQITDLLAANPLATLITT